MINWEDIDTVLLDMDGTLLDLHFDTHFWLEHLPKRYASIHHCDIDATRSKIMACIEQQRGTLNWYCLDYWSKELQLDMQALKREIKHLIKMRPFVDDFLDQLQRSKKQLILVTNAHQQGLDIKLEHTGLARWFDHIIVSHDYQTPKEELLFWQRFSHDHPFDPERTLLIDDNQCVLKAAQQFGIKHLLTLLQPDSQQTIRDHTDFPGILHFDEILPTKEPTKQ